MKKEYAYLKIYISKKKINSYFITRCNFSGWGRKGRRSKDGVEGGSVGISWRGRECVQEEGMGGEVFEQEEQIIN